MNEQKIIFKMMELEQEMKSVGLWQKEAPAWVNSYEEAAILSGINFSHWLQFLFISNYLPFFHKPINRQRTLIVPQALKYFSEDVRKGKLIQILIELDSLF